MIPNMMMITIVMVSISVIICNVLKLTFTSFYFSQFCKLYINFFSAVSYASTVGSMNDLSINDSKDNIVSSHSIGDIGVHIHIKHHWF